MTETLYARGALDTPRAFLTALVIGVFFGLALERAGFGSSRKLAGIFYFRDMAVLKVMLTAVVVAMLGLSYCLAYGVIRLDDLYFMETYYGAAAVGGLVFGVGFVMGGWCPGTAVAGLATGSVDALLFLLGVLGGSIAFNELYPLVEPLYTWGGRGVLFAYDTLGVSRPLFAFGLTVVAVVAFWAAELLEKTRNRGGFYYGSSFLAVFSLLLVVLAAGLFVVPDVTARPEGPSKTQWAAEERLLEAIAQGLDHIGPEELADRMMAGDPGLVVVDIRTPREFERFHLRGAVNWTLDVLPRALGASKNQQIIVLYSNGMTHPAQARDALYRLGYRNVYMLTDGLEVSWNDASDPCRCAPGRCPPERRPVSRHGARISSGDRPRNRRTERLLSRLCGIRLRHAEGRV